MYKLERTHFDAETNCLRFHLLTRMSLLYRGFFSRILESLPPLPRQHLAAIGVEKVTC